MVSEVSTIRAVFRFVIDDRCFSSTSQPSPRARIQTFCVSGRCQAYYSSYRLVDISLLDFELSDPTDDHRFFTSIGRIKMVDVRGRNEEAGVATDFKNLGGWLEYSAFAVEVNSLVSGVGEDLRGTVFGGAYSLGDATGTTPAFGNATWTGTMVGGDTSLTANRGNRIMGDATLTFDLSQRTLMLLLRISVTLMRDACMGISLGRIFQ